MHHSRQKTVLASPAILFAPHRSPPPCTTPQVLQFHAEVNASSRVVPHRAEPASLHVSPLVARLGKVPSLHTVTFRRGSQVSLIMVAEAVNLINPRVNIERLRGLILDKSAGLTRTVFQVGVMQEGAMMKRFGAHDSRRGATSLTSANADAQPEDGEQGEPKHLARG